MYQDCRNKKQRESSSYHNIGILFIILNIQEQSEKIHILLYQDCRNKKLRESSSYHNIGMLFIILNIQEQSEKIHILLYVIKSRVSLKSHITLGYCQFMFLLHRRHQGSLILNVDPLRKLDQGTICLFLWTIEKS
jgi:hypothetical protein